MYYWWLYIVQHPPILGKSLFSHSPCDSLLAFLSIWPYAFLGYSLAYIHCVLTTSSKSRLWMCVSRKKKTKAHKNGEITKENDDLDCAWPNEVPSPILLTISLATISPIAIWFATYGAPNTNDPKWNSVHIRLRKTMDFNGDQILLHIGRSILFPNYVENLIHKVLFVQIVVDIIKLIIPFIFVCLWQNVCKIALLNLMRLVHFSPYVLSIFLWRYVVKIPLIALTKLLL